MNIATDKRSLLRHVARAAGVADRRGTMPVLCCVLLRYQGGTLTVSATDLYLSMVGRLGADGSAPGAVALNARDLIDRVKAMPDGPITIASEGGVTTIKGTGARRFKMSHLPGEEFPELPSNPTEDAYHIACADVATVLARASYAVSPDETRSNLNSLELEFAKGHLGATGTDGHRLAHVDLECPAVDQDRIGPVLLPLKGAKELAKLVADGGTVSLAATDRWLFATIDESTLSCKLADAAFPAWRNVIPKGSCETVTVPRRALLDCVRAVSVASPASTNGVRLTFGKGVLRVASDSPEKGDAVDEVPIDYAGKPVTIGFAARYLTEALECLEAENVGVEVRGELVPIVVRDGAYAAVVMPMRILQWATPPRFRGPIRRSTRGSAALRSAPAARTATRAWRHSRVASARAVSSCGARTPPGMSPAMPTGRSRSRGIVRPRRRACDAACSVHRSPTCSRIGPTCALLGPACGA